MTLPPNNLPVENPVLGGDLLAVLGQNPAGLADTTTAAQAAAPFCEMLAGVGAGGATTGVVALLETAPAAPLPCAPAVLLYSTKSYTTVLQPSITGDSPVSAPETDEANIAEEPAGETPKFDNESAVLLAYEFIAGQWVQKPQTSPQPTDTVAASTAVPEGFVASATDTVVRAELKTQSDDGKNATPSPGAATVNFPTRETVPPQLSAGQNEKPVSEKRPSSASKSEAALSTASPAPEQPASAKINLPMIAPNPSRMVTGAPPEKIAAPDSRTTAEIAPGVDSLNQTPEKKTLVADGKTVKSPSRTVGMSAANRETSMPYSAVNKSSAPAHVAQPQPLPSGGIQSFVTAPVAEISATAAAQAPRLVQEIHAIADRMTAIDRNTVEVRFDFNDTDRLSVRVEYRDGTVHTTFRTDSDTLRDAIAREWRVQIDANEPRAYRVAEPSFSTSQERSLSVDLSQSGLGSGQSHSRSFEQQASLGSHSHPHANRTMGGHSPERQPVSSVRPETSHHLHTFA